MALPDLLPTSVVAGVCVRCGGAWVISEDEQTVLVSVIDGAPSCGECATWWQLTDADLRSRGCRPRDG